MRGGFRVGEWLVRPELGCIESRGRCVHVEPKVMQVLQMLAELAGELVSREKLIQTVWEGTFVTDDALTRSISVLRKVFEDCRGSPRVIQTISKRGYRLIAPVTALAANRNETSSLAVLPFSRVGGDPQADWLVEAMAEAVIESLEEFPRLRVTAWSAVLRYLDTALDPLAAGRELGVGAVLAGRVIRHGERSIIQAEVVEVATGWRVWGAQFHARIADISFALVEDLASEIAASVYHKLAGGGSASAPVFEALEDADIDEVYEASSL